MSNHKVIGEFHYIERKDKSGGIARTSDFAPVDQDIFVSMLIESRAYEHGMSVTEYFNHLNQMIENTPMTFD